MPSSHEVPINTRRVIRQQLLSLGCFISVLAFIVSMFYWQDRRKEWRIREEQAAHRLELSYELITRDLARVRSDILYVAGLLSVRDFVSDAKNRRQQVEHAFRNLLLYKQAYQQIRLLDTTGKEIVRLDLHGSNIKVIPESELQDKSDRYYFQLSTRLSLGQVFVSEFDLNQEYGEIERPLNPVIRFVTPVADDNGKMSMLLVLNYSGARLLDQLKAISLPGSTYLVRSDGQFLLGPVPQSEWGWVLGHDRSIQTQFPDAWKHHADLTDDHMTPLFDTPDGAFAFRDIQLHPPPSSTDATSQVGNDLVIVSYLEKGRIFSNSRQLLNRLLVMSALLLLPVAVLTRFWSVATERRQIQNTKISESERRLRELSARLVRIQEEERRAISREIHDQLGQQVTAINLDLKLLQRENIETRKQDQLRRAIDESEQLLQTLHDFARRVRPVVLDDLGLNEAVESYLWEFQQRSNIASTFSSQVDHSEMPPIVATHVYRLIQESLSNVLKHANATQVDVSIDKSVLQDSSVWNISVSDNGVGNLKSNDQNSSRLGILGMQERVELLGGALTIDYSEQGTTVKATVPVTDVAPMTDFESPVRQT